MRRRSTGKGSGFRVLVATDGSPSARAALMTACVFPWPRASHARGVVAWSAKWFNGPSDVRTAVAKGVERLAENDRRHLRRRWPEAEVILVNREPADGILGAAKRFSADVVVLGWRGHGAFRRLLMGSVSRRVVEGSSGSVLVVRRRAREIRRVVIGVDSSQNARRAVDFAARLDRDGLKQVTVVCVVEPKALQTAGLLPSSVRATVNHGLVVLNKQLMSRARREVDSAAARLKRAGWSVRAEVRSGAPLAELLRVVEERESDVLIVGARAAGGVKRALLGSVAAGALNHSSVPVLLVR